MARIYVQETLAQLDLNREGIMETFAVAWSGTGKFDTIEYLLQGCDVFTP